MIIMVMIKKKKIEFLRSVTKGKKKNPKGKKILVVLE